MKNTFDGLISRLSMTEKKKISELEYMSVENLQHEMQTEKKEDKKIGI